MLSLFFAAASTLPGSARAQQPDSARPLGTGYPDWLLADSNLINADWAIGTITKNTLYVMFKPGTTEEDRFVAVRAVRGVILQRDSIPLQYLIHVASHPNACAVKQAMALLGTFPQVAAVLPHMLAVMDSMGNLRNVPGVAQGPAIPCPSGYGLLK
jgi:hypothetical protein